MQKDDASALSDHGLNYRPNDMLLGHKAKASELSREMEHMRERIVRLVSDYATSVKELRAKDEHISLLHQRHDQELTAARDQSNMYREQAEDAMRKLAHEKCTFTEAQIEIETETQRLADERDELKCTLAAKCKIIEELSKQKASMDERLYKMETMKLTEEALSATFQRQHESARKRLDALQTTCNDVQGHLSLLQKRCADIGVDAQEAKQYHELLSSKLIVKLRTQVREQEVSLVAYAQELSDMKHSLDKTRTENGVLIQELERLRQIKAAEQSAKSNLENQAEMLRLEKDQAEQALLRAQKSLAQRELIISEQAKKIVDFHKRMEEVLSQKAK